MEPRIQYFADDIPGVSPDVESVIGPEVGDVDVCKVTHHGSKTSTTDAWLSATDPEVCILSVGSNSFGHPTSEALGRLHDHGVETRICGAEALKKQLRTAGRVYLAPGRRLG